MGEIKKRFLKLGSCSQTYLNILDNDGFGHSHPAEERAADPLAGGILRKGEQCGMLWGATMATGAEAYRRGKEQGAPLGRSLGVAIVATRHIVDSFVEQTGTTSCREITRANFANPFSMAKYMVTRARNCFNLAEDWAPAAIEAAERGLEDGETHFAGEARSCASECVAAMGGSEEEQAFVAGLAGGLGLRGDGCGALAAAIWKASLDWSREPENQGKSPYDNPRAKRVLAVYDAHTQGLGEGHYRCREVCQREFADVAAHSAFVAAGGCRELIATLAAA